MNTISALPPERVELLERTLVADGVAVPALLKPQNSRPGFITLCAWVPGGDPLCTQLATEILVCECHTLELERLLHAFSANLRQATATASTARVSA